MVSTDLKAYSRNKDALKHMQNRDTVAFTFNKLDRRLVKFGIIAAP